ncbi:MAG: DNA repair protein [Alphaproteobacteria bacterium HGW-Alphaproteobacteria-5]|nr:MAG: DNA repair protein [Alphaproteobacteria bacterium HGW-Alphaproteobacteria-5]
MVAQFTTIGHSNRKLDEFLEMLRDAQVDLLIDVRSFPRSRTNPAFNIDTLPDDLARVQIGYRHCPALGGRRPKQSRVDETLNAMWRVKSFHNYSDYALCDEYAAAFDDLVRLGSDRRLAVMCAEAVWWRCHRRIITDYLLLNGHAVDHLMVPGRIDHATLTPGAQRTAQGKVIYPATGT